jgi:hypothetical protein
MQYALADIANVCCFFLLKNRDKYQQVLINETRIFKTLARTVHFPKHFNHTSLR